MKTIFSSLFIILSSYSFSQVPQYIQDELQNILDNALPNDPNPGAVMTVYVPGQWTWSGATGSSISGMTGGTVLTTAQPSDLFRVGSISKTFTSVSILQLYEAGLLDLDDPIDNYLRPSLINDTIQSSATVTIRQLLDHTSGIANSADNLTCQQNALANLTAFYSIEENIYCGASQGELFTPGSSWYYSNTNYGILAMIVEEITGNDYWNYVNDSIITPLNLSNTLIPTTNEIQGNYMGCYWDLGAQTVDMSIVNPSLYKGWAEVVSNTSDLTLYFEALSNGQLIDDTTFAIMKTITPPSMFYSLGLEHTYTALMDFWGHSGSVGNTSGMYYVSISTPEFPDGYYIAYNFTYEGVLLYQNVDLPVWSLLMGYHLSVDELANSPTLEVFPNPATDNLQLTFSSSTESALTLKLYDLSGNVLRSEIVNKQADSNVQLSWDIRSLSNGMYILEALDDESGLLMRERVIVSE
jgi:CubicO group peptidase (beta-lactamase class C family)